MGKHTTATASNKNGIHRKSIVRRPRTTAAAKKMRRSTTTPTTTSSTSNQPSRRLTGTLIKQASAVLKDRLGDATTAARTNLTSLNIILYKDDPVVGQGAFRIAYSGVYVDGIRHDQPAVCKAFRPQFRRNLQDELYQADFRIADTAIRFAQDWNRHVKAKSCSNNNQKTAAGVGQEILMTRGDLTIIRGTQYLVEPFIRYFEKFTANNGWIQPTTGNKYAWKVQLLEAFTHFTYHKSGGQLIVCDLQGRYRHNPWSTRRRRFELTDPAVCSRKRLYGATDLGIKGIQSFFYNHQCNKFCGLTWARPTVTQQWFDPTSNTSMMHSSCTPLLDPVQSTARFNVKLEPIFEYSFNIEEIREGDDEDDDDEEEDEIVPMKAESF